MGKQMRELLKKGDPKGIEYFESKNILEENKKAHNFTDESKSYELGRKINDIVSDSEDMDNGEIYNKKTGITIRDLT